MSRAADRLAVGFALLEALVAIVIIAIGLLGLAALSARSNQYEFEALQRVQAVMLVNDMVERFETNRVAAGCYSAAGTAGGASLGTCQLGDCDDTGCNTDQVDRANADMGAWHDLLRGTNSGVAPLLNARGCIAYLSGDEYLISVAWQGVSESSPPPENATCGSGVIEPDEVRRVVFLSARIARLCESSLGNCLD